MICAAAWRLWRLANPPNDRWETIDFHGGLRHSARIV
jgi:hypothetical protein